VAKPLQRKRVGFARDLTRNEPARRDWRGWSVRVTLWSYEREGWARRFFENWRGSLKWQRLKPYEREAWGGRRGTQGNGGWEAEHPRDRVNRQREEPDIQWKAAAFVRWHEPDDARVSSPDL
jgi:hypothetical protein